MANETHTLSINVRGERALLEAAREFERLDETALQAAGAVGAVERETKKASRTAKSSKMDMASLKSSLSDVASGAAAGITTVTAIAAAITAAGMAANESVQFMSGWVDNVSLLSERVGLSSETIIGMQYAAKAAGVELSEMEFGLASFTKKVGDAAGGSKQAADTFTRLGVSVKDSSGRMKSADVVLRETLRAISSLPTPTERAAAALEVFGTRGGAIAAAFGDGGEVLDEWSERAKDLGLVLDDSLTGASERADESVASLSLSIDALKVNLGENLEPAVDGVSGAIARTIDGYTKWIEAAENLEDILDESSFTERMLIALTDKGAEAAARQGEALDGVSTEAADLAEELGLAGQAAGTFGQITLETKGVLDETGDAAEDAADDFDGLAGAQDDAADAAKRVLEENKRLKKWLEEQRDAEEKERDKQLKAIAEEQKRRKEAMDERIEGELDAQKQYVQGVQEEIEETDAAATAANQMLAEHALAIRAGITSVLGTMSTEAESMFLGLFKKQKKANIASIIIDTARNAVSFAAAPPAGIGFPAGPVAAAALGVAQLATVKGTQPKLHLGTPAASTGSSAPSGYGAGDRMVNMQVGEVYTGAQQGQILDLLAAALNRPAVLRIGSRGYEAHLSQSERIGGAMARAARPSKPGQRRYRG